MPKKQTARSRTKVKDLPREEKKVSKKQLKTVKGAGDYNADGQVDSADYSAMRSTARKGRPSGLGS